MKKYFARLINDESGATAIEYGLIASLISIIIIAGVSKAGSNMNLTFNKIAGNL